MCRVDTDEIGGRPTCHQGMGLGPLYHLVVMGPVTSMATRAQFTANPVTITAGLWVSPSTS